MISLEIYFWKARNSGFLHVTVRRRNRNGHESHYIDDSAGVHTWCDNLSTGGTVIWTFLALFTTGTKQSGLARLTHITCPFALLRQGYRIYVTDQAVIVTSTFCADLASGFLLNG